MNLRRLSLTLGLCAVGACAGEEGASPSTNVGRFAQALSSPELDVLFVIDNSGSMSSEQQKLAREIPRMVKVLATGDLFADSAASNDPGVPDEERLFKPVRSLHMGVVSTNMGGLIDPPSSQAALLSCSGLGDDGILQQDTAVATQGIIAHGAEFGGFTDGATVLTPDPTCALGTLPPYQTFEVGVDASATAHAFACTARLGIRGCPFEQPLESMWKALAPNRNGELFTFSDGTRGQGELKNAGFLRENAALAVIILTDEDDCSISTAGRGLFSLSDEDQDTYGPINLRCGLHEGDTALMHATQRFVDGLMALKPGHPERVLFAPIVGVPLHAQGTGEQAADILSMPGMEFAEEPFNAGFPKTVCTSAAGDEAYPARRIVSVAKGIGAKAYVSSICEESYAPAIDALLRDVAPLMGPHE